MAKKHELPPLPYAYDALEPHIDEQTMRLHHDKHHLRLRQWPEQGRRETPEARAAGDFAMVKHWSREAAFTAPATSYTRSSGPTWPLPGVAAAAPSGVLAEQINKDFGSVEAFKAHFSAAANAVEGSGWALLVWQPVGEKLEVLQSEKHHNLTQWGVVPLLVLDVWEHAYYLKYQNNARLRRGVLERGELVRRGGAFQSSARLIDANERNDGHSGLDARFCWHRAGEASGSAESACHGDLVPIVTNCVYCLSHGKMEDRAIVLGRLSVIS